MMLLVSKSSAINEATNLGLVHFDYSPAWNGGHSPPIGSIAGCWITEPRTFVRIVAACPPPPRRGIFRLVSLASGWRRWSVGRSAPFRHQHLFKRAERIPTEVDEAEAALSR
jgi:hypothetical protein